MSRKQDAEGGGMKFWQMCFLLSAIYIAPHQPEAAANIVGVVWFFAGFVWLVMDFIWRDK